jgi:hypothetical protein
VARARGMAQGRVGGRPWIGEGRPKVGDDGRLGMTCGWGLLVGEREGGKSGGGTLGRLGRARCWPVACLAGGLKDKKRGG